MPVLHTAAGDLNQNSQGEATVNEGESGPGKTKAQKPQLSVMGPEWKRMFSKLRNKISQQDHDRHKAPYEQLVRKNQKVQAGTSPRKLRRTTMVTAESPEIRDFVNNYRAEAHFSGLRYPEKSEG